MVRPRFAKLAPAQQEAILRAALEEFAAHGFHDASLNRVIETAGISKGSLYYYFDGKEDLFAHVTRVEFTRLLTDIGSAPVPEAPTPDAFWSAVQRYYRDSLTQLTARPQLASLVRAWLNASDNPALQQAQQDLEREIMPWVERVLASGQSCGAIRADLPDGLLIAVAVGMGRAMDTWLMTQPPADATHPPIEALVGMLRRALESPN